MNRTLIFDTETSGLTVAKLANKQHQPHVIEFYGCIVDEHGEIIKELEFLCKPPNLITEEVKNITGITNEMVANELPFKSHAAELLDFISEADSICAHNLAFDWMVLNTEFDRAGITPTWPLVRICTVANTEYIKGYRLSLTALHEHLFGEGFPDAHRAKNDVMALVKCFNELRKRGEL